MVSVCLPTYQGARHLGDAIDSVLSQSYQDFELVIVDDASHDPTVAIVQGYGDERIRLFRNDRRLGQVPNYNHSLQLANGAYLKPMHQDDVLDPMCLEKMVDVMNRHPDVALVFGDSDVIDSAGECLARRSCAVPPGLVAPHALTWAFVRGGFYNLVGEPPVAMFRKSAWSSFGMFDPEVPYSNDLELWLRYNSRAPSYSLGETVASIRFHTERVTHDFRRNLIRVLWNNWRFQVALQRNTRLTISQQAVCALMFLTHHVLLCSLGWALRRLTGTPEYRRMLGR